MPHWRLHPAPGTQQGLAADRLCFLFSFTGEPHFSLEAVPPALERVSSLNLLQRIQTPSASLHPGSRSLLAADPGNWKFTRSTSCSSTRLMQPPVLCSPLPTSPMCIKSHVTKQLFCLTQRRKLLQLKQSLSLFYLQKLGDNRRPTSLEISLAFAQLLHECLRAWGLILPSAPNSPRTQSSKITRCQIIQSKALTDISLPLLWQRDIFPSEARGAVSYAVPCLRDGI